MAAGASPTPAVASASAPRSSTSESSPGPAAPAGGKNGKQQLACVREVPQSRLRQAEVVAGAGPRPFVGRRRGQRRQQAPGRLGVAPRERQARQHEIGRRPRRVLRVVVVERLQQRPRTRGVARVEASLGGREVGVAARIVGRAARELRPVQRRRWFAGLGDDRRRQRLARAVRPRQAGRDLPRSRAGGEQQNQVDPQPHHVSFYDRRAMLSRFVPSPAATVLRVKLETPSSCIPAGATQR